MQITLIFAIIISFMLFTVLLLLRPPLTIGTFRGFIFLRSLNSTKTRMQITILHFSYLTIRRGWTMHRKLHVDTLILIPTFKIYVFSYSRQTETLIRGGFTHFVPPGTPAERGLEELFFRCPRKVSPAHQCSTGLWYIVQEFGW